jgi:hypothetical protein
MIDCFAPPVEADGLVIAFGIHLTAAGAAYYEELVVAAIGGE